MAKRSYVLRRPNPVCQAPQYLQVVTGYTSDWDVTKRAGLDWRDGQRGAVRLPRWLAKEVQEVKGGTLVRLVPRKGGDRG